MKTRTILLLVSVACSCTVFTCTGYTAAGSYSMPAASNAELPIAVLAASPSTGAAILHVALDAGASTVANGSITRYEWDFDSDGVFDYDSGAEAAAEFYYYTPGTYAVTLRVTSSAGATATASRDIVVSAGASWQIHTAIAGRNITMADAYDVEGNPALVFVEKYEPGDWENGSMSLLYRRAADATGTDWETEVELDRLKPLQNFTGFALFHLDGAPAIIIGRHYVSSSGGQSYCYLTQAVDDTGTAWSEPVLSGYGALVGLPVEVDGRAAMVGVQTAPPPSCSYCLSPDPAGDTQNKPLHYPFTRSQGWYPSLQMVDGRPAVSLQMKFEVPVAHAPPLGLYYLRANDEQGRQWPTTLTEVDLTIGGGPTSPDPHSHSLVVTDTGPAIAYISSDEEELRFIRANDINGDSWGASEVLATGAGSVTATLLDGRPVVLYLSPAKTEAHFIAANNASGTSWGFPVAIENPRCIPRRLVVIGGNLAYCCCSGGDVRLVMLR